MKNKKQKNHLDYYIGKWVIARTRVAGIIFGKVISLGIGFVELKSARRVHRPISQDRSLSWYEGVAQSGLCEANGRISGKMKRKLLVEDYELNLCSIESIQSLKKFKTNETTL